jgi:hypothetical protein
MTEIKDEKFFERADAHIDLANQQVNHTGAGRVSASMMYATARFNAWTCARGFQSGAEMQAERAEMLAYFAEQYRLMLEENLADYEANFEKFMRPGAGMA